MMLARNGAGHGIPLGTGMRAADANAQNVNVIVFERMYSNG